jgi:hypothetical protein
MLAIYRQKFLESVRLAQTMLMLREVQTPQRSLKQVFSINSKDDQHAYYYDKQILISIFADKA